MPFEFVVLEALLITLNGTLRTDAESCAADKARLLAVLRRGMSGKLLTEAGRLKRRIDEVQSAVRGAKVRRAAQGSAAAAQESAAAAQGSAGARLRQSRAAPLRSVERGAVAMCKPAPARPRALDRDWEPVCKRACVCTHSRARECA